MKDKEKELLEELEEKEAKEGSEDSKEESKEDTKEAKESEPKADEELDLGIEGEEQEPQEEEKESEEKEDPIDKKELLKEAGVKPDFMKVAEIFLEMDKATKAEEVIELQGKYEAFLKETLVPKVKKALGIKNSGDTKKAGVKAEKENEVKPRVTTALKDRK